MADEGAKKKGYTEPLVVTYEGKRVYPSTTPDTLAIFHSAEMGVCCLPCSCCGIIVHHILIFLRASETSWIPSGRIPRKGNAD